MIALFKVIVALAVLFTLAVMSVSPYSEFTPVSRYRWCVSNQNALDKTVGIWESQNVEIPPGDDVWIEIDTAGRVSRVSTAVAALNARVPEKARLVPGGTVLFDYFKDENIFACPARLKVVDRTTLTQAPEVHYRWSAGRQPRPELCGRKRGVVCLLHERVGPREAPETPHRPCLP